MRVRLTQDPIHSANELADFEACCAETGTECGAIVSFSGLVRAEGGQVQALELEAYPGFTDRAIAAMAAQVAAEQGLQALWVAHRIGRIAPGETVVFVAAASAHRRAAFQGADRMMDYLKSRAPFWKRSWDADGARWIEPRDEDYQDAARWDGAKEQAS